MSDKQLNLVELGNLIKTQREKARLSLRRLAKSAGVSNPYLSQIERGLRRPSAQILNQIAKALELSAEIFYVQAGILGPEDIKSGRKTLKDYILSAQELTWDQRRGLLELYLKFIADNEKNTFNSNGLSY